MEATQLLLSCAFNVSAEAALAPHNEKPSISKSDPEFEIQFVLERSKSSATIIGNQGARSVEVFWGNDSVSFLELTSWGTPAVTTVDMGRGKPLPAVHSRHTMIGGLTPSQFYGECFVK